MSASTKQAQLRALMKQQQTGALTTPQASNRVDSPLATYTAKGDLVCRLCKLPVKSSALWTNHCNTPGHKQNLELLVSKKKQAKAAEAAKEAEEEQLEPSAKKPKFAEPSDDQEHHTEAPLPAESTEAAPSNTTEALSNVLTPAMLKELQQEWELQEEFVLGAGNADLGDQEEDNIGVDDGTYGLDMADSDAEDDNEVAEEPELAINAQQGKQRLILLQRQQEMLATHTSSMDQEEDSSEDESAEADSESSEEADINALYDWRARAV